MVEYGHIRESNPLLESTCTERWSLRTIPSVNHQFESLAGKVEQYIVKQDYEKTKIPYQFAVSTFSLAVIQNTSLKNRRNASKLLLHLPERLTCLLFRKTQSLCSLQAVLYGCFRLLRTINYFSTHSATMVKCSQHGTNWNTNLY